MLNTIFYWDHINDDHTATTSLTNSVGIYRNLTELLPIQVFIKFLSFKYTEVTT